MQSVAAKHETAFSSEVESGLGDAFSDHEAPSHASARTRWSEFGDEREERPTAMHEVGEAHETPQSWLKLAPGEPGAGCIDQMAPFQCSTSGDWVWSLLTEYPTAVQVVPDVHETAFRNEPVEPAGAGTSCNVQPPADLSSANGVT
jgi:hypothetical protein